MAVVQRAGIRIGGLWQKVVRAPRPYAGASAHRAHHGAPRKMARRRAPALADPIPAVLQKVGQPSRAQFAELLSLRLFTLLLQRTPFEPSRLHPVTSECTQFLSLLQA